MKRLLPRSVRAGAVGVLGLAVTAVTGTVGVSAAVAGHGPAGLAALRDSVSAPAGTATGSYSSSSMAVEAVLAPSHAAALNAALEAAYTPGTGRYHHWLAKGAFARQYAPSAATVAAVASYLRSQGLTVRPSASRFLVAASGSSAAVAAAFHTTLRTYAGANHSTYFANATAVQLPRALAPHVLGVVGLTNTIRLRPQYQLPTTSAPRSARPAGSGSSCQTPYPTEQQLFAYVDKGKSFPYGYGGGPGCSGLTPSQVNSIYGAPKPSAQTQGGGETIAVFELSAYLQSDIDTWAHQFYGPHYTPPLHNITTDGGPLHPVCPKGDKCPPQYEYYAGDIEVDADIEAQLAVAPDVAKLDVYEAPNDYTGQTELDQYTKIASDDTAAVVSSSWGTCEATITAAYAQAENTVFEQMALQGQSMFSSAGDTGAFGCIRDDGKTNVNMGDPAIQPWVTGVGGTSLTSFNPQANPTPGYAGHDETVWNVDGLCNEQKHEDPAGKSGYVYCADTGAGGGGSSQYWGRPFYQHGPGVTSSYTSTACSLAAKGKPCREGPDVSADADEYTPYAEYCTGSKATKYSVCAQLGSIENVPGWFGIGGTSLSSPVWSAIIADRDSYQGAWSGNINPFVYQTLNENYGEFFHDICPCGAVEPHTNGLYPITQGFDEATGVGTPQMAALITQSG